MSYRVKFLVSLAASVVAAVILLRTASVLSGGDMSVLPLFIGLFVVFGLIGSVTYYFSARSRGVVKSEQQLLEETKEQMRMRNGEKKQ